MAVTLYQFQPNTLAGLEANIPESVVNDLGTVIVHEHAYDDTTEEYVNGSLELPADIDTSGTVTFRVACRAVSGGTSDNVAFTFGHLPRATGEAIDGTYTEEDSGDTAIDDNAGDVTIVEWTETVSNLGWAAGDIVYFRFSRYPAGANNVVGDVNVTLYIVEVPLT